LPFTDGFERNYATSSTDVGLMPKCWNGYYKPGSTDYPSVVTYANTGSSSVALDAKSKEEVAYLVTEEIDIDSLNSCFGLGIMCLYASSLRQEGKTIDEVAATVVDRVLDLAGFDINTFRWGK
jgi:hypothetical protein